MNLKTAYIADWARQSAFDGAMGQNPLSVGGNIEDLSVDGSGTLTAIRKTRDGQLRLWLFPLGTWHGEPIAEQEQEQESPRKKTRRESLEFDG